LLPDHPQRRVGRAVIDCLDQAQAVDAICRLAAHPDAGGHIVVTPNIQHIALLERDPAFQAAYADASLTLADGWPVARAARTSRVPGSDLFGLVCAEAARRGLSVGIVGGRPGAAGRAVDRLKAEHPELIVAVVDVPSYGFERSPEQTAHVVDRVGRVRPDILFVALGAPKQEVFAHEHRDELNAGVILCVGAAVDFYAGDVERAPELLQHAGLEWAHRIAQEPGRLAGRYAHAAPAFVTAVVRQRVGLVAQPRPAKPLTAAAEAKKYAGAPWLRSYARLAVTLDAVTLVGATLLASWLRFGSTADQQPVPYTLVALVVAGVWLATLGASRAYAKRFLGTGTEEFRRVFHASLYVAALIGFGSFAVKLDLARGFLLLAQALGMAGLLIERSAVRATVQRRRRRGAWAHRVVLVGDARDAAALLTLVKREQHTGFNVVGLVLGNNRRRNRRPDDLPVYEGMSSVHNAIEELSADTVAVTGFGPKSRDAMRELSWSLEGTGVDLVFAPAFTDISGARISVRPVSGVPLLHLEQPELTGGRKLLKASVERVLALLGVLVLAPFAVLAAIAILID
jgi:exopolysaccharide biosynthesis WecB/TagA/CpsF family protein